MSTQPERYDPHGVESKWRKAWEETGVFQVAVDSAKPKYYLLEMFPYPSGRIHIGHVRNYSIGDVVARFKRMHGFNVLHPMGWDAFGMPAENAAIAAKVHPADWTYGNIEAMKKQLKSLGYSYDWKREFATCDPTYYKWEQKIFLQLLERGLAYRRKTTVNYCPTCQTVLANEQVEQGACWRCGDEVVNRDQWGWFLKITDYADELLDYTQKMPGWPERVLTMQRNWIGRSQGCHIRFAIADPPADLGGHEDFVEVFTTRQDTIFGATFMSLAPEHPLVNILSRGTDQEQAVDEFVDRVRRQNVIDRTAEGKEKEGVFTGAYCINPMTGNKIPVFAANFVLMEYGTGAVMAVPGHDQRDYDFATKYNLPIVEVIEPEDPDQSTSALGEAYTGPGKMINSGQYTGLDWQEGKKAVAAELEERNLGGATMTYRLRDWGISRQRYWGAPIPVIHCDKCGVVPVPEDQLPVQLPIKADIDLSGVGGSPLSQVEEFLNVECPVCGAPARRETDTMDTFVESSWYFERYCSPHCDTDVFDRAQTDYWMPVDQYIGGIEHAVLHLLYSRYWTKILRDLGYIDCDEPFTRLLTQGMVCRNLYTCPEHGVLKANKINQGQTGETPTCAICGKELTADGPREKMSKSKGNTVDPEEMVDRFGADTVRLFCLFASPPEKEMDWSDEGIQGASRFMGRMWRLVVENIDQLRNAGREFQTDQLDGRLRDLHRKTHQTIKKVGEEIGERWHFNTAIAAVMELVNETYLALNDEQAMKDDLFWPVTAEAVEAVVVLMSPIVPHAADELAERIGLKGFLINRPWPEYDNNALAVEEMTIVLQVNGKLRAQIEVPVDVTKDDLEKMALNNERVLKFIEGKKVRKVIVVPKKLVNVVV